MDPAVLRGLVSAGDKVAAETARGKGGLSLGSVFCRRNDAGLDASDAARSPGEDDQRVKLDVLASFDDAS